MNLLGSSTFLPFNEGTICEWIQKILHPHWLIGISLEDQHHFQLFAVNAIDIVWGGRNHIVHEGKSCDMEELARRV